MAIIPVFLIFNLLFCVAIALPASIAPTANVPIEQQQQQQQQHEQLDQDDEIPQQLIMDFNHQLQEPIEDDLIQRPELFEYKIIDEASKDAIQKPDILKNSTIENENGNTIIKNETIITRKTDLGEIVWHLKVTETRANDATATVGKMEKLSVPATITTTAATTAPTSTQTTNGEPVIKFNLFEPDMPVRRVTTQHRDDEFSSEQIDDLHQYNNEFFDDIDGLENVDNDLQQKQLPNLEQFDFIYNHQPSTEFYANHKNDYSNFNVIEQQFPIDLTNDIAVNQKLHEAGAPFNPDAEFFNIDDMYEDHQRPMSIQSINYRDIK